jgi:hypothetical protein
MPDDPPEPTNDADVDLEETLVFKDSPRFLELPMSLCQVNLVRPLIDAAQTKRRGVIFLSTAPNIPDPFWKLQAVSLSQKAVDRITKIIRGEIGSQK